MGDSYSIPLFAQLVISNVDDDMLCVYGINKKHQNLIGFKHVYVIVQYVFFILSNVTLRVFVHVKFVDLSF